MTVSSGNKTWTRDFTFVEAAAVAAPWLLTLKEEATSASYHAIRTYITGSPLHPWNVSIIFSPMGERALVVKLVNGAGGIVVNCDPKITAPTITAGASQVTQSELTALANGTYQCSFQGVPNPSATTQSLIMMDIAIGSGKAVKYIGDGNSGIHISSVSVEEAP